MQPPEFYFCIHVEVTNMGLYCLKDKQVSKALAFFYDIYFDQSELLRINAEVKMPPPLPLWKGRLDDIATPFNSIAQLQSSWLSDRLRPYYGCTRKDPSKKIAAANPRLTKQLSEWIFELESSSPLQTILPKNIQIALVRCLLCITQTK